MSEFSTGASLDIFVEDRQIRQVREQIEDGIGRQPIQVEAETDAPSRQITDGGQDGGMDSRQRRRARRGFRMEIERTDHLEEIVELLHSLDEDEGGDGGGFSVGLGGLTDVGGAAALGGAAAALTGSAAAMTGAAKALTGAAAALGGSAVLDIASDFFEDDELEDIDVEELEAALDLEEPEWVPIAVDDPSPLGVDHPEEPYAIDHPEEPYAVDHPEEPYSVDHPEEPYELDHPEKPYAIDHPEEPYAVDHPEEPYSVEDPSPLAVEPVDDIGVDVSVMVGFGAGQVAEEPVGHDGPSRRHPVTGEHLGPAAHRDQFREQPATGAGGGASPSIVGGLHKDLPGTGVREGLIAEGSRMLTGEEPEVLIIPGVGAVPVDGQEEAAGQQSTVQTGGTAAEPSTTVSAMIRNDVSTGDVSVDVSGFDDLERQLEQAFDRQIDDVMDEIDDVRDDLDDLRRNIGGR